MSDPVRASLQELRALADLVKNSADAIEKACIDKELPFPSLDEPFTPQSEGARMLPEVQQAAGILVSAAAQLIAVVRPPPLSGVISSLQFHISSCLRVAIENHVIEILRDSGPQGLHVRDIAAPSKVNPEKLARVLRLLATHHIFREVAPDTFVNNRISSSLDTGKSIQVILADPAAKYDNTSGIAAITVHSSDEVLKSAAYLQEVLSDPELTSSGEPTKASFNKAFKTDLMFWEWFDLPENAANLRRFGNAMTGLTNSTPASAILEGFDWKALPKDSVVVDVGGGVGSQTLVLAKAFDHLKFVVQDRPSVIAESAPNYWKESHPEAISSGQVTLQGHDFFAPQKIHGPAVFTMRMILHDWSDDYSVKILRHLRDAAGPHTQLVIVDSIVSYACPEPEPKHNITVVSNDIAPPAPLLPNYGVSNSLPYLSDLQMLNVCNASERTLEQFDELFAKGGWKLSRVHLAGGQVVRGVKLIAVPA
ncbi:O-methyltransferase [Trametopsis cervina]|nr:O-methyltransferase [Trametopsis cervina]